MQPFDRQVRAQVYNLFRGGARSVDAQSVSTARGWDLEEVEESLRRLHGEHRIVLLDGGTTVWMAHPFSGVETPYQAVIGERSWFANCAWDALGILAILGDGQVRASGAAGELTWTVANGTVVPEGIVHLLVPAANFWEEIGFT